MAARESLIVSRMHHYPNSAHHHHHHQASPPPHRDRFHIRAKWEFILVVLVIVAGLIVTTIAILKAKEKRETWASTLDNSHRRAPDEASTNFATVETHRNLYEVTRQQQQHRDRAQSNRTKNNRYQEENEFHTSGSSDVKVKAKTPSEASDANVESGGRQVSGSRANRVSLNEEPSPSPGAKRQQKTPEPSYPLAPFGFDPNVLFHQNQKLLQNVESTGSLLFPPSGRVSLSSDAAKHQTVATRKLVSHPASYVRSTLHGKAPRPMNVEESEQIEQIVLKARPANLSGNRVRAKLEPSNHRHSVKLDDGLEDKNYLTSSELLWLQQNRPDLFQVNNHHHSHLQADRHRRRKRHLLVDESRSRRRKQAVELDDELDDDPDDDDFDDDRQREARKLHKPRSHRMARDEADDKPDNDDDEARPEKKNDQRRTKESHNAKLNSNRYTNEESQNVEKLDILGSGNFEIIRGGIIEEDKADDKAKKAKKNKKVASLKKLKKGEESRQPVNQKTLGAGQDNNNNDNNEFERRVDDEKKIEQNMKSSPSPPSPTNEFEPFNLDLFGGSDPLLGFQGYDNFGNAPAGGRSSRSSGLGLPLDL